MPAPTAPSPAQLQLLAPSPLEPQRMSQHALAVSELRKISAVRVSRRRDAAKGVTEYKVSVSLVESPSQEPATHARRERLSSLWVALRPTVNDRSTGRSQASGPAPSRLSPPVEAATVHEAPKTPTAYKRLSDFEDLRVKVYSLAMTSHNFDACEFCEHALHRALWGGAERYQQQRGSLALLVLDENKLLETLAALVRDLVALCASPPTGGGERGATPARVICRAQKQLPGVVQAFLYGA